MPFNLPIFLTWCRIVLIPLFVGIYYLPERWLPMPDKNLFAAFCFALAAITDWFDGYLARALGQTTSFGAFLDPVADKLMVAAALILLVNLGRTEAWIAVVIIGREITISALREWMAQLGRSKSVAVTFIGKLKTAAQMVAILLLLYAGPLLPKISTLFIGELLMLIAAVLTLWSMIYYLRVAWPLIKHAEN
ncbi:CDP-diacylglycerol--glycerol-3-phosphate 3-phosphatidyltransferase [Chitinivorax sp. B]|uniref:CDP-diacylglycerol--glycerol-3-phosphate 3-phosphatidyltransferase n=1 Tax=Chitinivorax sp. B TaxID=2502235 RepID=UPI0010F8EE5A|nr:CDP-diacylglycerol--glycerol-3-phosphate 3-phosphatidyltransferase [Chitinivorax sp. B]